MYKLMSTEETMWHRLPHNALSSSTAEQHGLEMIESSRLMDANWRINRTFYVLSKPQRSQRGRQVVGIKYTVMGLGWG